MESGCRMPNVTGLCTVARHVVLRTKGHEFAEQPVTPFHCSLTSVMDCLTIRDAFPLEVGLVSVHDLWVTPYQSL